MDWVYIAAGIILLVLFLHSGYVFTRKLPAEPTDSADCIVAIVRYGYIWIFVLLFVGVAPFIFVNEFEYALHEGSPIQVVNGCRAADLDASGDQPDRQCVEDTTQWWLNIGGLSERQRLAPEPAQEILDRAITAMSAALGETSSVPPDKRDQIRTARNELKTLTEPPSEFVISGGLSVPLYMVILALLGGLISMTRRIPEIQKRGSLAYKKTYENCLTTSQPDGTSECKGIKADDYPLEPERVREYVIFQMMQAVTAPLIAATAYALIGLQSTASVVAVGFISGFASESVLVQIRKAADTITGQFAQAVTRKPEAEARVPKPRSQTHQSGGAKEPKPSGGPPRIGSTAAEKSKD